MMNNGYDINDIKDAILLQAEGRITYSPGSANSPILLILLDPGASLAYAAPSTPARVVLVTATDHGGGLGF